MTVNKRVLIDRIAPALGGRRPAALAVEAVLDVIVRAVVDGEQVSVTGFGTFQVVEIASRTARNPKTGDTMVVPARRVPRFRPHSRFRDFADGRRGVPQDGSAIRKDPKGTHTSTSGAA
ncbi:HU family DNA-binding protein [Kitasatospora sp. NPDC091257]|uniref:HU family DNA-binding protein n=1 Tax=Kitasatospora sp. NPDC091257 TaxID=3364084 RepID=UPI0037F7FC9E